MFNDNLHNKNKNQTPLEFPPVDDDLKSSVSEGEVWIVSSAEFSWQIRDCKLQSEVLISGGRHLPTSRSTGV